MSGARHTRALSPASATRPASPLAAQVHRLVSAPERLFLSVLVAMCDALEAPPAELIVTQAHNSSPRRRQRQRLADLASRRPTRVRLNRDL
ncbi:MAG: helix-turn-helix domain-containing protein [Frankiaceae bacterium]|nr:helix-turn-helix domain-containing protein [Frankiaceae bacterium]